MKLLQKCEQKNVRSHRWGWGSITLLCIGLLSMPAQAIWLGQSQVNPYLEVQGIYESNLYNASENEESGFVTVVSPGIHAEFPNTKDARFRVIGNYRANFKFYDQHGDSEVDPNEELNTTEHRLDGRVEANLTSGVGFAAEYVLNLGSYAPSGPLDTRDNYTQHDFLVMGKYSFIDRYEIRLQYNGMLRGFDEDELQDDEIATHGIDATFFYRLFPSLTLLGGGGYSMVDRQDPPFSDSTEYRGYSGVRFDPTSTVMGEVKVGVVSKDFKESAFEDVTSLYLRGELGAQFTETTKLTLLARREVVDTSIADTTSGNGEYYIITGFNGNIQHSLAVLPNLTLKGLTGFRQETYPEDIDDREDTIFEVGAGVDYKFFKYLILGAQYIHTQRDSSIDSNDYNADRAILSVRGIL